MSKAIPQHSAPVPELPERKYTVVSHNCAWGEYGQVITHRLTDANEAGLIQGGVLAKYVPPAPTAAPATPEPAVEASADTPKEGA